MSVFFELNATVTWQTPEDLNYWKSQYERILKAYRKGPFVVIDTRRAGPHEQQVRLRRGKKKIIDGPLAGGFFPSSWLKLAT